MISIAILNPLGDFGINQYCWELAEALGEAGARVTFYTSSASTIPRPKHHECLAVLHRLLAKGGRPPQIYADVNSSPGSNWIADLLRSAPPAAKASTPPLNSRTSRPLRAQAREIVLTWELAVHLRARGFDIVWSQWPDLESYAPWFGNICRRLGMRFIHTVHNVLPHEYSPQDVLLSEEVYRSAELLFVHSNSAARELVQHSPRTATKVRVSRHGLYNLYPRFPHCREGARAQLGLQESDVAVLFAGGIRPYKNLDAAMESLREPGCERMVLIVAGKEAGYSDLVPSDPLGRTFQLASRLGIANRVRLLRRFLSIPELSELFEASDVHLLPYTGGSGSGMLLLGMTFGKYIVSSAAGGADEYLADYGASAIVKDPANPAELARVLRESIRNLHSGGVVPQRRAELEWSNIAREVLACLRIFIH